MSKRVFLGVDGEKSWRCNLGSPSGGVSAWGGERHCRCALLGPGLPETRWLDHLHGGRGQRHPDLGARNERCCRCSADQKENEPERRVLVPLEVVRAAFTARRILLSATAPGPPADFSGAVKRCLKCIFKPNLKEGAWRIKDNSAVGYSG